MNTYQLYFNSAISFIGIVANYAYGGWNQALSFLALLVVVDYFSGVYASIIEGTGLSSKAGFKGIFKKVGMFVLIAVLHSADTLLGTEVLMIGGIYFYIANELLSIIENLGRVNFPMPPQLKQIVEVLKGKGGSNESK